MSLETTVKKRLEKILEKKVKERAEEIYAECVDIGDMAISQFYAAYSPIQYHRSHSFDYVCSPFKHKLSSIKYEVGIRVLEGVAGGHKDPDEYVFHGVMEMGVHGTSDIAVSTPPMEVIRDYFSKFD